MVITRTDTVWVVPAWLFYGMAAVAEWGVWILSLGRKESHLNRQMVRYLTMTRTFDISKAKHRLGYRPQVSVKEGIRRAVNAYMSSQSANAAKDR
jgi:sterol-4alpha-carboxylate 3-dehydrogenase (decarboxylating)